MFTKTFNDIVNRLTSNEMYSEIDRNKDNGVSILQSHSGSMTFAIMDDDASLTFLCEIPGIQDLDLAKKESTLLLNSLNNESAVVQFYCSSEGTLQGQARYPHIFDENQFDIWFSIWEQDLNLLLNVVTGNENENN